jgi:protein required for attachment to host cells
MSAWILVGDASRAVVYSATAQGMVWEEVDSFVHPGSRLKNSELSSTEPGHAAQSKGGVRHTAMEPKTSPKEAEKEHFAQQMADVLNSGSSAHRYNQLVVVAPAHFASLLEHHLSSESQKRLHSVVHKDYHFKTAREARATLENVVFSE